MSLILAFANKSEQEIVALLKTRETEIVKEITRKKDDLLKLEQEIQSKKEKLIVLKNILNQAKNLSDKLNEFYN